VAIYDVYILGYFQINEWNSVRDRFSNLRGEFLERKIIEAIDKNKSSPNLFYCGFYTFESRDTSALFHVKVANEFEEKLYSFRSLDYKKRDWFANEILTSSTRVVRELSIARLV